MRPPINLGEKLATFTEHWSPRVVAELDDYQFKLVKLQGEFVWHHHTDIDEAFLVLEGEMEGIEHITGAARECSALLIEPRGVVNTGGTGGRLTAKNDVWT